MRHIALVFALGCASMPTQASKAQDAAHDLNLNARFGRLELASERVAPEAREAFAERHKHWGGNVRIADLELVGFRLGKKDAVTTVRYAWYRPNEQDLRSTSVRQTFRDHKGVWLLVTEEHAEGDLGLFGEVPRGEPEEHTVRKTKQFQTIRIGVESAP